MSQDLFTDLTIEQQETVAGGSLSLGNISDLSEYNFAKFSSHTNMVQFNTTASAGPGGATSTKTFGAGKNNIFSFAGDYLNFNWL
jgi:hypothetical protein